MPNHLKTETGETGLKCPYQNTEVVIIVINLQFELTY